MNVRCFRRSCARPLVSCSASRRTRLIRRGWLARGRARHAERPALNRHVGATPRSTTSARSSGSRRRLGSICPHAIVGRHVERQCERLVRFRLRHADIVDDQKFRRGLELVDAAAGGSRSRPRARCASGAGRAACSSAAAAAIDVGAPLLELDVRLPRERRKLRVGQAPRGVEAPRQHLLVKRRRAPAPRSSFPSPARRPRPCRARRPREHPRPRRRGRRPSADLTPSGYTTNA